MISTIKPNTGINEKLVKYRCIYNGKFYIFDNVGNMMEISEETYNNLRCKIKNPRLRRKKHL